MPVPYHPELRHEPDNSHNDGALGRVSQLKHRFGWARTLMDGIQGAQIWCGYGLFAHNLVKVSELLTAKQRKAA